MHGIPPLLLPPRFTRIVSLGLAMLACAAGASAGPAPAEVSGDTDRGTPFLSVRENGEAELKPVPVIFDTDMDTDCDDAGALAVLHALADRGEVKILGTLVSSRYPFSVPCVEAINGYYGRPDLPVGCPKGDGPDTGSRGSRYARQISERFPARHISNEEAPDAVQVYHDLLSSNEDGSVVVVTVGYLTNLETLLRSEGGSDLVRRKVRLWVCMGGRYPNHLDPRVYGNFKPDPGAAVYAAAHWPGPIVFSGLGDDIETGGSLGQTQPENPVRQVYELYLGSKNTRPSWDPIAVLYAACPQAELWEVRRDGYNHIFDNGTNEWREGQSTRHALLQLRPGKKEELRRTLEKLMAAPPRAAAGAAGSSRR